MPDLLHAPLAYADEETVDQDFVHHLVRGSDLLQAGELDQARGILERALQMRPRNERGQHLLALSYFRLGLFGRAEEIYRALAQEHPADPALRVNLGLSLLKQGRPEEAIPALLAALQLAPGHRKAQSYLGVAHLQRRDFASARDWFERAGNTSMAERLSHDVGSGGAEFPSDVPDPGPDPVPEQTQPHLLPRAPASFADERGALLPEELTSFTHVRRLEPASAAVGPFSVSSRLLVLDVQGELLARTDGLVATFGALELRAEHKRFRGRLTDRPFGEGGRRMRRVSGRGRLWVATQGRRFHVVEFADEPAYFREEALFAFEESLLFENGRVPSRFGADLHLVHLRNRGHALLVSRHPPRSVELSLNEPCCVPMDVLLGWYGNVAPRIVAFADEASAGSGEAFAMVELSGEGWVLLDAEV